MPGKIKYISIKQVVMQYTNSKPSRGETRYWSFIGNSGKAVILLRVIVEEIRWDYENDYDIYRCKIQERIVDSDEDYTGVANVIVDYPWQLQETLQKARALMFQAIFSKGVDAFVSGYPPF